MRISVHVPWKTVHKLGDRIGPALPRQRLGGARNAKAGHSGVLTGITKG